MLELASQFLVSRMVNTGVINEEERAIYTYNLQVIIESLVGHAILLIIAALCGHFLDIFIFLLSFDLLRRSSGGFHCKTNTGCIVLSSLVCIITVVFQRFIETILLYYQGGGDSINDIYIFDRRNKSPQYGLDSR